MNNGPIPYNPHGPHQIHGPMVQNPAMIHPQNIMHPISYYPIGQPNYTSQKTGTSKLDIPEPH